MNQQMQPAQQYSAERKDELDLIGLWKIIVEYKLLIIVFTTITTLSAIFYTSTLPTIYKAEVLILPSSSSSSNIDLGGLASLSGLLSNNTTSVESEEALARLKTRSFLSHFIKKENLKPILFAEQWNKEEKHWIDQQPSDEEAYELLFKMINIHKDSRDKSGLIIFSLNWENPVDINKIADVANNLVRSMNSNAKRRTIVDAKNSVSFLEKELEHTNILKSQTIIYSMIEQQMQQIMLANVRNEFVFKVIDPAVSPKHPENNFFRKITIALFGFILSLLFSTIAVLLFERNKQ